MKRKVSKMREILLDLLSTIPFLVLLVFGIFLITPKGKEFFKKLDTYDEQKWSEYWRQHFIKKSEKKEARRLKKEGRNYIIVGFYRGRAQFFSFIKFKPTEDEAKKFAKDVLYNTMNWQAIVFKWDPKNNRKEYTVVEYNTFSKKHNFEFEIELAEEAKDTLYPICLEERKVKDE